MKNEADAPVEEIAIKVVGKSGQISLGKRFAGKTLRLERHQNGTVVLTAVAMVPESQLWTLAEPHRSRIEQGLAWAASVPPKGTNLESLLTGSPSKAKRTRGRRA